MQKTYNFLGFVVGAVGLIIAIISYINSNKKKEVSYNIVQPSYKILDNEAIVDQSNLMILTKDSSRVDDNIYLTTISFWNTGDLTINKSDVRKPVAIQLKGVSKIIDFKLIKEEEAGVSKFRYNYCKDSIFDIDWKFFDPTNGIKFQILYTGSENLEGFVSGKILDTKFKEFKSSKDNSGSIKPYNTFFDKLIMIGSTIILVLLIISGFYEFLNLSYDKSKKKYVFKITYKNYRALIYPIFGLIAILYFFYFSFIKSNDIPF